MSGASNQSEQQQQQANLALMQLPQLVFNSFATGMTPTEITALLSYGRPLLTLIMSPPVAKSFALGLLDSIRQYEQATGLEVPTFQELNDRMLAHSRVADQTP
jgi:hypothetical protein